MDQTHIGYTYWQEPPRNVMPRVDVIQVPDGPDIGCRVGGTAAVRPRARVRRRAPRGPREPTLPEFDALTRQTSWIEVFNRGAAPFDLRRAIRRALCAPRHDARHDLRRAARFGERRLGGGADRHGDRADHRLVGSGRSMVVQAIVRNPASPRREAVQGFVGSNGYVSMEAEHYSRAVAAAPIHWTRIPDLGPDALRHDRRAGDDGKPDARWRWRATRIPDVAPRQRRGDRARISVADVELLRCRARAAIRDVDRRRDAAGGERFGGQQPSCVGAVRGRQHHHRLDRHQLARAGEHVLKFWLVDPGVVLQKIVVDAGGVRPSYLGPPESWRSVASEVQP